MGDERLDQELPQDAIDSLNLDGLCGPLLDPRAGLGPGLVQSKKTALAATLDELVRLRNEFGASLEQPGVGDLGLVEDVLDGLVGGEVQRSKPGRRVVGAGGRQRGGLDDGSSGEVVVEDGLAVGLEDGLGGHDGRREVLRRV